MSSDQLLEQDSNMSFLDHLEVLRWHLIRIAIAILLFSILAFLFKSFVFDDLVLGPASNKFITYELFCQFSHFINVGDKLCFSSMSFQLINITMAGQFSMHLIVSIIAGIIASFPYVLFEIWRFIKPALQRDERNYAKGIVFWGSLLFIIGVLFGYYLIAPLSVQFLGNYKVSSLVENQISLRSYIMTVSTITLSCGLIFQLPIIIYFLSKLGLVTPKLLRTYRRHAIVVVLLLAAVITPPDISSQILVALPLLVLYEISIWISRMVQKEEA